MVCVGESEVLDLGEGLGGGEILQLLVVECLQVLEVLQALRRENGKLVLTKIPGKTPPA